MFSVCLYFADPQINQLLKMNLKMNIEASWWLRGLLNYVTFYYC